MRRIWRMALLSLALGALTGGGPAWAQGLDCLPIEALNAGHWARAEETLRANLGRPDCASLATDLRFSLAHVIEKQAAGDPKRACEARDIYREAVDELKQDTIREVAVQGAQRTGAICECSPPSQLRAAGQLAEAEAAIRERLAKPMCKAFDEPLRFELAMVIEQDAGTSPKRACEALPLYEAIAADQASERAHVARVNASRMRIVCDSARSRVIAEKLAAEEATKEVAAETAEPVEICAQAGDEDANGLADCADPACGEQAHCIAARESHQGRWLGLTIGAAIAATAGSALLITGAEFDADRERAEADFVAANAAGDAAAVDAARSRWSDAKDRAVGFGVAGWASLAAAAGMGLTAAWIWRDGPDLSVVVGPASAEARWSF